MARRSPGSVTPFRQHQEELTRREAELRDRVEKLERMIAEAPEVAREMSRRQREELRMGANARDGRLNVSITQEKRHWNDGGGPPRQRSLRKERREGRLVFLILVIALAAAVVWLMTHLHF
jgi:hypothetical protein